MRGPRQRATTKSRRLVATRGKIRRVPEQRRLGDDIPLATHGENDAGSHTLFHQFAMQLHDELVDLRSMLFNDRCDATLVSRSRDTLVPRALINVSKAAVSASVNVVMVLPSRKITRWVRSRLRTVGRCSARP